MNARTEFQVIVGSDGKPAFVVVPYEQFCRMIEKVATAMGLQAEQLRW